MKKETAAQVHALKLAILAFADDYSRLPELPDETTDQDSTTTSDENLIAALVGADKDNNPKGIQYLKAKVAGERTGGLISTDGKTSRLVDSWGNELFVILDTDYNRTINAPFGGGAIAQPSYGVEVWSAGPDGKTNPDPDHKDNRDNICSWK